MKMKASVCVMLIAFISMMGCTGSGTRGKLKTQSASESKITQQSLFNNWSDYAVWVKPVAIVFDPKNDNQKILVSGKWGAVTEQETWNRVVKTHITGNGNFTATNTWAGAQMTGVREIWGPDNQLYGYIIHLQADLVSTRLIEENTLRLFYHVTPFGAP